MKLYFFPSPKTNFLLLHRDELLIEKKKNQPQLYYDKAVTLLMPSKNTHNREYKNPASLKPLIELTADSMLAVNEVILARMESTVTLIPQLAGHLIAAGGKRMRPMLALAGAMAAHSEKEGKQNSTKPLPESALCLAAAVEFIHNATLLHDDVIDDSHQRRGQDTANALWGNEASVLVGDFLFARAFELMVKTGNIIVLEQLASVSAQITEGEIKQMTMAGKADSTIEDYLSVITKKTAILFAAAAESGARVRGAQDHICTALYDYGLALGMAFQICDDALDYRTNHQQMGKNSGDDFYDGKITLPVILAWQNGNQKERDFWCRTLTDQSIKDGDFEIAQTILSRHQAIDRSLDTAQNYAQEAIEAIAILADTPLKSALREAAHFAVKRSY